MIRFWSSSTLILLILMTINSLNRVAARGPQKYEDFHDEFAEFEDFDAEDEAVVQTEEEETIFQNQKFSSGSHPSKDSAGAPGRSQPADNVLNQFDNDLNNGILIDEDDDDSEFEHFQDVEEFEGFESKDDPITGGGVGGGHGPGSPLLNTNNNNQEPKITITKVPVQFEMNWESYWLEILMMAGILVYFTNFMTGKKKNTKIANAWLQTHKQLLEENFCLVGGGGAGGGAGAEDASGEQDNQLCQFNKESENVFNLWCSGRTCCEGMLVELKLIKRQDLIAVLAGMARPAHDQIHIKVFMNKEDMDSYVFCLASKKTAQLFSKEMSDLSLYCPDRKSAGDKHNLPPHFQIMSELSEVTSVMLDAKVTAIVNKYPNLIDYVYLSDQHSGAKQQPEEAAAAANNNDGVAKPPECQKMLLFGFNIPSKGLNGGGVHLEEAMNQLKPLLVMVFYYMEKVKRYRLSKEGKAKADKNRQRVEEVFLKSTHQARTEAAAARREEKRRLEKERILAEKDPDRQRRWEEKEQKRQAKKRAPKMKQLKVKAL